MCSNTVQWYTFSNYIYKHLKCEFWVFVNFPMKHRGEIVQQAVKSSGFSTTTVAQRLGLTRGQLYNYYDNPKLPLDTIVKIGKVLHYDFSQHFPELKSDSMVSEPEAIYNSLDHCRKKLFEITLKYNDALEQINQLREKYGVEKTA